MIDLPINSLVVIIALLLLLSAFFSASEIALFTFRKTRLAMLVKQENKNAILINNMMQRPETVLSTILIGNNIVNTASSVLATVLAIELFHERGVIIAMLGMAFLTIQFSEIIPKALASQFWEKTAFAAVRPVRFFSFIFYPFVSFFSLTTRFFGLILGIRIKYRKPIITKDELRHTVDIAKEGGNLKDDEAMILQNIFKFTDRTVQEVMLPREKVDLINLNASSDEILKIITDKHHTRIPIYEGTPDNIVGILYTKDYMNVVCYGQGGLIVLQDLIRKPYMVSENIKTSELLKELQKNHIHLAIVKDDRGKFNGIITIEDIMEEIVGEIMDEHDIK
jgi:CBS domain containing-hemolysin-like protein